MLNIKNIRKDSYIKLISSSSFCLPLLEQLHLNINLKNILKINKNIVIKMVSLLEIIAQQKPIMYFDKIKQKNKIKQKQLNIVSLLILRKNNLLLFFENMNISLLSEMLVHYLIINLQLEKDNYKFIIKNVNILKDLDSNFFSWKESISLNLIYKNSLIDVIFKENKNMV